MTTFRQAWLASARERRWYLRRFGVFFGMMLGMGLIWAVIFVALAVLE